jgi:hypothetical protein
MVEQDRHSYTWRYWVRVLARLSRFALNTRDRRDRQALCPIAVRKHLPSTQGTSPTHVEFTAPVAVF